MTHFLKSRWVDYIILGLSVFLIFCLVFESYIELPRFVSWLGRWHPLVLHFPIVLLLLAIFLGLTGREVPRLLLFTAVLSALITAISGFFLGKESLVKGDLLLWHQWLGAGVALVAAIWYALSKIREEKMILSKTLQGVLLVLIGFTGHYGGMVTHGEDFLALPIEKKQKELPENPLIYGDVVTRILDEKCVSCHNPNKQKGELLLTDLANILKGGENGNTVIPENLEESELIKRLHLPIEDEEHMPPEGKTPLTDVEIEILERWIALGASDTVRLSGLKEPEPLIGLVRSLREPDPSGKWANFPKIADSTLQNLSSDYLSINRVASNTDALSVDVYLAPEYDSKPITNLKRVAKNIVELDLSGLPIGSLEIDMVSLCTNLEWLELDKTPVGDEDIEKLIPLEHLRLLKIYETSINDKSLLALKKLKNLKRLYLWGTGISDSALKEFNKERPNMLIDNGIDPETEAFFVANDTIVDNKEE
ncbi:c-type cytochrome domain-containing protein [Pseudozobellia sp. WGM2]|uniref:c-type cytochrome domain-containing protein n=1 Tax=Pseudozobellia sp. WGM2 TaxID=2787625 RepID=UPI001ADF54C0|nr:c-type cytochrome domain-containing protein [Pseudozobellia sp. WGM2]